MENGGILSDSSIKAAQESGDILIDPFTPEQLNGSSYDVLLGEEVAVYDHWVETYPSEHRDLPDLDGRHFTPTNRIHDIRKEPQLRRFKMSPEHGWVVKPGIGYLMHTKERIRANGFVPVLDGKSSTGRLFITVHVTAGYGDPFFDGQFTLEVKAAHPIRIFPGMRIGQVRFHTVVGPIENPYNKVGHYRGEFAEGAVVSQAWRQFIK